jgi:hypothetical protein
VPKLFRKRCIGVALSYQHLDINEIQINLIIVAATLFQEIDSLARIENHEGTFLINKIRNHVPDNFIFVLPKSSHWNAWVVINEEFIVRIVQLALVYPRVYKFHKWLNAVIKQTIKQVISLLTTLGSIRIQY